MFKKILIANRGEIAVRVIRTGREMGIPTLALYQEVDRGALHMRLADESVLLTSPAGFMDQTAILAIARQKGADAIHPGYGFLAEEASFAEACCSAGITFIGPPAEVIHTVRDKIGALARARQAGFETVAFSARSFGPDEWEALQAAAEEMGYPLVIKSCSGGRGPGERLVQSSGQLARAVRRAQTEARATYGRDQLYLEKAILPAHQVSVQILAGSGSQRGGGTIHLGDREGSIMYGNRKLIEESPAPCLSADQRRELWQVALELARLFDYANVGSVEFLVDGDGRFYFSEIKARLQVEHPLTEMLSRLDLVREQIQLAAGERLAWRQEEIALQGWAMMARIGAEDPWHNLRASPGRLEQVRLPGGSAVRVDSYVQAGATIPADYDPLIAKLTTRGPDRASCLNRLHCALREFILAGIPTTLPLLQRIIESPDFVAGRYSTSFNATGLLHQPAAQPYLRDLAVAAAVLFLRRNLAFNPSLPDRVSTGWHRESRRLPQ